MKVSVIIAAYNIEKYIERCLKSILNQTLSDVQIIVVNDGSKDNTLEVIKAVINDDKRVLIIDKENSGTIEARKSGFNSAQGEYILFVDGDDWLEKDALEKLYYKAKKSEADIVLFNAFWSYDNKKEVKNMINIDKEYKQDLLKGLLLSKVHPAMWAKFIRRDFIIVNDMEFPTNMSYAEDLATVSVWFMNNPKVEYLEDSLYNYYQRNGSITKIETPKILEVDKAREFIKYQLRKKGLFEKYKNEFNYLEYKQIYIYRFLGDNIFYLNRKDVYKEFKNKKIDINNNKYIRDEIRNYSISFKFRVKIYNFNYYLGELYDFCRNNVKA